MLWNTLSGLGLLGALYAALSGMGWIYFAVFLTLGLFGHLGELVLRLRSVEKKLMAGDIAEHWRDDPAVISVEFEDTVLRDQVR